MSTFKNAFGDEAKIIAGTHCQACGSTDWEDIRYTEEFEGYSTCCNEIVVGRCMSRVCYHD